MREEYVKKEKTQFVDGVEVFDLGEEYVFNLEDKDGVSKEFHLTKPFKTAEHLEKYIADKKKEMRGGE